MDGKTLLETINGARCAVLGFGISNRPLVRFLLENGALSITVHDKKDIRDLGEDAEEWMASDVRFVCGEDYLDRIDADVIFRSPGIRDDKGGISDAVARGAVLSSEMELFFALTKARIIGVTGSDGKTTTTTLIAEMLKAEYGEARVYVGGNIGRPLLPLVDRMTEEDFAVVELSSFQLKTMKMSPWRAVITNLSPNHLDWHTDMKEYIASKRNIFSHRECTRLITNADNAVTTSLTSGYDGALTLFSGQKNTPTDIVGGRDHHAVYEREGTIYVYDGRGEHPILKTSEIQVPGRHNVENHMTAIGALEGLVSVASVRFVALHFGGVEHRLELVRTLHGVRYYNSSIDSSPTRTEAALSALAPIKPIIICGGYDKHIPYDRLGKVLCERAKAVVLMGATAGAIGRAVEMAGMEKPPVYFTASLGEAVQKCRVLASEGDIVLLSPASASFDAFVNFEERGRVFKKLVKEMKE